METIITRLVIVFAGAALILATMCGCALLDSERWYRQQLGLEYILDMEDAGKITQWTLEQKEVAKVRDGINSLTHIIEAWENEHQRREAAAGFQKVYRKALEGWPDVQIDPDSREWLRTSGEDNDQGARKYILGVARRFAGLLHRNRPKDPLISSLWDDLVALDPTVKDYVGVPGGGIFDPKPASGTPPSRTKGD